VIIMLYWNVLTSQPWRQLPFRSINCIDNDIYSVGLVLLFQDHRVEQVPDLSMVASVGPSLSFPWTYLKN